MNEFVFVYGTLKKGYGAHHKLSSGEYLGPALTPPIFKMNGKRAGFPMIFLSDQGHSVLGEVYSVNDSTLAVLDQYEGVPHFYKRMKISVKVDLPDHAPIDAWVYYIKDEQGGNWAEPIQPNVDGVLIWTPQERAM